MDQLVYWCAFHYDFSGIAVFDDELACYKYALANHMQVKPIRLGRDIRDQINAPNPTLGEKY